MDTPQTTTNNLRINRQGFTLIEMVVATFIFVVVVVAMFDLFILAQKAQRTAASLENLQDDMRFSVNRIADEVRDGSIDYAYYASNTDGVTIDPTTGITNTLAIRTFDGTAMRFMVGTGTAGDCVDPSASPETKKCLLMKDKADDPASIWHSLSTDGISMQYLMFYITPTKDPFEYNATTQGYNVHGQPRARIVLVGSGKVRQSDTKVSMFLQTLISTREYRR